MARKLAESLRRWLRRIFPGYVTQDVILPRTGMWLLQLRVQKSVMNTATLPPVAYTERDA
jgi:hypothetical protein